MQLHSLLSLIFFIALVGALPSPQEETAAQIFRNAGNSFKDAFSSLWKGSVKGGQEVKSAAASKIKTSAASANAKIKNTAASANAKIQSNVVVPTMNFGKRVSNAGGKIGDGFRGAWSELKAAPVSPPSPLLTAEQPAVV